MSRGYHSYRGRASGKKIALVIVLLVLLLASAAYLVLQDYIVYHSDGSVSLELPFRFQEEQQDTTDQPSEEEDPSATQIEILPTEEELIWDAPLKGKIVAPQELTKDTFKTLADEGYTGVVVELKGFNGMYEVQSDYAKEQAILEDAVTKASLKAALSQRGSMNAIAVINCFHDSFAAYGDMAGAGICQKSGYIWYDNLRSHWLDPYKEGTITYLSDVMAEALSLGFQELVLTDFTYPTEGKLSLIDDSYRTVTKTEALLNFLLAMQEKLGETRISVSYTEEQILTGQNETSGISVKDFLPYIYRLVITEVEDLSAVEAAVLEAGGEEALKKVVILQKGSDVYQK